METNALKPGGAVVYRHRVPTRLWHWLNALSVSVMLMSGLMIFNAHPALYWGKFGADHDPAWLQITPGHVRVGPVTLPTLGIIGTSPGGDFRAFPGWITIPNHYDLAGAREWHFAFAWVLVVPIVGYLIWGFAKRHVQRDLAPTPAELSPANIWHDVKQHARLRFPTGEAASHYNILQKLAYNGVIFLALPGIILTGMAMSPGMDAAWPWLLAITGGRQSARSIHFLCMAAIAAFIVVHLAMVVLAGPVNELRSMLTGRYRLPAERPAKARAGAAA